MLKNCNSEKLDEVIEILINIAAKKVPSESNVKPD